MRLGWLLAMVVPTQAVNACWTHAQGVAHRPLPAALRCTADAADAVHQSSATRRPHHLRHSLRASPGRWCLQLRAAQHPGDTHTTHPPSGCADVHLTWFDRRSSPRATLAFQWYKAAEAGQNWWGSNSGGTICVPPVQGTPSACSAHSVDRRSSLLVVVSRLSQLPKGPAALRRPRPAMRPSKQRRRAAPPAGSPARPEARRAAAASPTHSREASRRRPAA